MKPDVKPGDLRVESGTRHALAWCRKCPPWRVLRGSRADALEAAAEHAERCHAAPALASDLRERARDQRGRDTRTGR